MSQLKYLLPFISLIIFHQTVRFIFTPSAQYLELWNQAYKEIQVRSIDKLPKDSPLLERCSKPDPYYKPCSQKLNLQLGQDFC